MASPYTSSPKLSGIPQNSSCARCVLVVVHQETSSPGLVGELLRRAGYHLDLKCPAIGHDLPSSLDAYDAAIVFGGPMSANDDTTLPFIRQELDWIGTLLESGKPYLGICLGAQLLARVLGAKVAPHPEGRMEIGYNTIAPTSAGQRDLGNLRHVFQWHREGFELPRGATLLASGNSDFPNQAFRYGDTAIGLQFHPEITHTLIDRWTTAAPPEHLQRPEAQPREAQFQAHALYSAEVERWLTSFLNRWVEPEALVA